MNVYCCESCMSDLPSKDHAYIWESLCKATFQGHSMAFNPSSISSEMTKKLKDLEHCEYIVTHETKDKLHIKVNGKNYTETEIVFCIDYRFHSEGAA